MFLRDVEGKARQPGPYSAVLDQLRTAQAEIPEILHLFAFKPELTGHLERFSQAVMRGPSPLSPGWRELIAAFTSRLNHCAF